MVGHASLDATRDLFCSKWKCIGTTNEQNSVHLMLDGFCVLSEHRFISDVLVELTLDVFLDSTVPSYSASVIHRDMLIYFLNFRACDLYNSLSDILYKELKDRKSFAG